MGAGVAGRVGQGVGVGWRAGWGRVWGWGGWQGGGEAGLVERLVGWYRLVAYSLNWCNEMFIQFESVHTVRKAVR